MRHVQLVLVALVGFFGLLAGPSYAQATRTWVSGVGDDANPCSRTAPCKTFPGAISKTAAGGEISVLDPGGFGTVTITKSISLVSDGNEGSILAAGTTGITVNAGATDVVSIRGIQIEGAGTGTTGIRILQAGSVYVSNVVIRGFQAGTGRGIDLSSVSSSTRLFLERVEVNNNLVGLYVHNGTGFTDKSVFETNSTNSLVLDAATASMGLSASILAGNPVSITNGGSLVSTGNNFIAGPTGPTSTVSLR